MKTKKKKDKRFNLRFTPESVKAIEKMSKWTNGHFCKNVPLNTIINTVICVGVEAFFHDLEVNNN